MIGDGEQAGSEMPDREAVVDLLGVLAYGELAGFDRMAEDARMAPTLADKTALAGMAVAEFQGYQRLCNRLLELGVEPAAAMEPFIVPVTAFHDSTEPKDWFEGLVKAYVGDGIANDFYREIAQVLDLGTRALVLDVVADTGQAEFAVARVREAIAADPSLAGRLALWARRLVGEALIQAQRVAVERDGLVRLLVGGSGDLVEIGRLLQRLTEQHAGRVAALGLSS